jgi:prevent-host-death family protein
MKRAQIQLEEEVYELLRHRAFKEKKSIAGVIREIVKRDISQTDPHPHSLVKDFTFIGRGRSKQGSLKPVSEWHDEARLSEVIKKAAKNGPQEITVHGEPAAVVISSKEYERLKHPRGSFVEYMRRSPLYGLEFDLHREQTLTREAEVS